VNHLHGRHTFGETIGFNLSVGLQCTSCTLHYCIQKTCAYWQEMVRKWCSVVTFAYLHVSGTENEIMCTPAIQWLMKVYVNGLLVYNVPHLLSLAVYKWCFRVDRKWLRTATQLLGCRIWWHSSEMWITCTVAISLVRQLDSICLLVCNGPHAHSTAVCRKRVHIGRKWWENAAESLHLHICM